MGRGYFNIMEKIDTLYITNKLERLRLDTSIITDYIKAVYGKDTPILINTIKTNDGIVDQIINGENIEEAIKELNLEFEEVSELDEYLDSLHSITSLHYRVGDAVITNTKGDTYLLKGVWVTIKIGEDYKLKDILLSRDTFYEDEICNSYMHSHTPSINPTNTQIKPSEICLGHGIIADTVARLKASGEKADYLNLILLIQEFIETENTKGAYRMFILNYGILGSIFVAKTAIDKIRKPNKFNINIEYEADPLSPYSPTFVYYLIKNTQNYIRFNGSTLDFSISNLDLYHLISSLYVQYVELMSPENKEILLSKYGIYGKVGPNLDIHYRLKPYRQINCKTLLLGDKEIPLTILKREEEEKDYSEYYFLNLQVISSIISFIQSHGH